MADPQNVRSWPSVIERLRACFQRSCKHRSAPPRRCCFARRNEIDLVSRRFEGRPQRLGQIACADQRNSRFAEACHSTREYQKRWQNTFKTRTSLKHGGKEEAEKDSHQMLTR